MARSRLWHSCRAKDNSCRSNSEFDAELHVEASFDGGVRWSPVPTPLLGDRAVGLIVHPRDATAVSLRGRAADVDGNPVEQIIIPAYTLAPR